jgi:hypothetical protein
MYTGILHLHNLLRWVILLLLVINLISLIAGKKNTKLSMFLMISTHIMLVVGMYQYLVGELGLSTLKAGMGQVMSNAAARYWAVEHFLGMLGSIILITLGHGRLKRDGDVAKALLYFGIALILILIVMPWPFKEGVGRPLFPGM